MALQRISESVYVGLCVQIGTSQQVTIRREVLDISELLNNSHLDYGVVMNSGSRREGLRFVDSDTDCMAWPKDHRVYWDFSHFQLQNPLRHIIIICDSSVSPPGFTLLWLPFKRASRVLLSSCVKINGALYISSTKYRNNTSTLIKVTDNFTVHGPCSSGKYLDTKEYDLANCFCSEFWPPSAYAWIDRCQSWPPPYVVDEIVKSGCHLVAIGHKHGAYADNEWRISFSRAEQKLVYAMNHTQLLTYGLLKIFVKEINKGLHGEEKLLCSYHMKTTIFWVIQQNIIPNWCPQNLLAGFWVCLKLLIKWVYEGVCPNFFIPENNMFLNKVYGAAQEDLFTRLYSLYEKGVLFLLHSSPINFYIMKVLCNPGLPVCTNDRLLISEAELDNELFAEVYVYDITASIFNPKRLECLGLIEQLVMSPLTQCQIITLQSHASSLFRVFAFTLHDTYSKTPNINKQLYIADKISCYMLKLTTKFGCVSDSLYIAMYFYKTFRYREALSVIEMTKLRLAQPGLMGRYLDHVSYTMTFGGQTWSKKRRRALVQNIKLENKTCYINELIQEQQSGLKHRIVALQIPPVILLYMLEFLCCRYVDPVKAQSVLDNLQSLVHNDQGVLVDLEKKDISWEILGICQQITGNLQSARKSYQQSLKQFPLNGLQTATRQRIQDLH